METFPSLGLPSDGARDAAITTFVGMDSSPAPAQTPAAQAARAKANETLVLVRALARHLGVDPDLEIERAGTSDRRIVQAKDERARRA